MAWKSWIPGYGDKTVRQRVWELEQKAGSLPMIFAVLIGAYVTSEARHLPLPFIPERYRILLAAIAAALIFIYRDKRERAAQKVKEQANKVKGGKEQMNLADYKENNEN